VHGAPLMYSSQVPRPRAPSSAKSRPHLKRLGSRLAPASDYAQFTAAARGPRPLACFRLSSGNSGGTGGCEASTAAGPWGTIGDAGYCWRVDYEASCYRSCITQRWRPWRRWRRSQGGTRVFVNLSKRSPTDLDAQNSNERRRHHCDWLLNLKHESVLCSLTRQAISHKPALSNNARPRGPWRVKDSCAQKPNSWRPTTAVVPEPPATCGTWPVFVLDSIRCRCRRAVQS
jgi:hypothetical protein